jgi:hypothetical protein
MAAAYNWFSKKAQERIGRVLEQWARRRPKLFVIEAQRWAAGRAANDTRRTATEPLDDGAVRVLVATGELVPMMPGPLALRPAVIENMRARRRGTARRQQHRSPCVRKEEAGLSSPYGTLPLVPPGSPLPGD